MLHNLRARALQQAAVRHTRWTSSLAIQAAEAAVNVGDERLAQRQTALVHLHHLVDAAARRIHLRAQRAIGRTLVEAQSAVDTLGVQVPRRLFTGQEVRDWLFRNWSCRTQKRNLPRFKTSFRSSACFTARMLSKSVGVASHSVICPRASSGQCNTAMLAWRGKRSRTAESELTKLACVGPDSATHSATRRCPTPTRPIAANCKPEASAIEATLFNTCGRSDNGSARDIRRESGCRSCTIGAKLATVLQNPSSLPVLISCVSAEPNSAR